MQEDITELIRLNEEITTLENTGDLTGLGKKLASKLAFQRRDGSIVNREEFLTRRPGRRIIQISSVTVYANRAVVICVVTDGEAVTHNIRLFVKEVDQETNSQQWKLLGWANEPA